MKRNKVRKGIVVLAIAAASAVSIIGHGATSQASNTPVGVKGVIEFPGKGNPVPNSFGSVWL